MRKFRPYIGVILSILFIALCCTTQVRALFSLPDTQRLVVGETSNISFKFPTAIDERLQMLVMEPTQSVFASPDDPTISITKGSNGYEIAALKPGKVNVQLKLLGYIPIKSIAIESIATHRVVVGGHSIGVLLQSHGIMVVGFAPVINADGQKTYPAKEQGIEIGDLIMQIDAKDVTTENDLALHIDESQDKVIDFTVKRRGKTINFQVTPEFCLETNRNRIGLYVRDGVVGVGTMSFWDPQTKEYAALGHIIMDADTKQGIEVLKGKIVSASIQTIKPGKPGKPGEKIGIFNSEGFVAGNITKNTYYGIFGKTDNEIVNPLVDYIMEVGYAHQVKEGKAEIYTVVNGDDIESFEVYIEKVYPERENGKGMIIKVTDPRLLSLTGGIIQGMSGSPIVQNSRIVGAVTHVFLNDPERGYGIFMDNMLSELPSAS
ncbi:MAG TPA: SpoIVB peptidase [Syntrophomonadaceae bacterium]|nr:SpoIVB peptidase [Syntrophomonadaceae bacterium]